MHPDRGVELVGTGRTISSGRIRYDAAAVTRDFHVRLRLILFNRASLVCWLKRIMTSCRRHTRTFSGIVRSELARSSGIAIGRPRPMGRPSCGVLATTTCRTKDFRREHDGLRHYTGASADTS